MNADVLRDCFRRLIPHLDTARIALTGGVAIGLHTSDTQRDRMRRLAAGDVDFVADNADAVRQTVTTDFLVSHYHLRARGAGAAGFTSLDSRLFAGRGGGMSPLRSESVRRFSPGAEDRDLRYPRIRLSTPARSCPPSSLPPIIHRRETTIRVSAPRRCRRNLRDSQSIPRAAGNSSIENDQRALAARPSRTARS